MRRGAFAASACAALYAGAALLGPWTVGGERRDLPGAWRLRRLAFGDDEQRRARHRAARLEAFAREAAPSAAVLLMGSSTVERLDAEALWPGASVRNRGVADEPLAAMLERLPATLDRVRPRAVVLYPASVDARRPTGADGGWRPVPELTDELRLAVDAALGTWPELDIVLLEPLPETEPAPPLARRLAALREAYRAMATSRARVHFVPLHSSPLVDPATGLLARAHAADRIHLGPSGCEILSEVIGEVPAVRRFLR